MLTFQMPDSALLYFFSHMLILVQLIQSDIIKPLYLGELFGPANLSYYERVVT